MAVLIKSDRTWATEKNLDEWLIQDGDELATLPDTTGPGSIAYTADMSLVAMMNEDEEWKAIVGTVPDFESNEEDSEGGEGGEGGGDGEGSGDGEGGGNGDTEET